jgi:hypothetical protein
MTSVDFVKASFSLRTERREDITQIDGVLGVSVKVGPGRKPRRAYPMNHSSVRFIGRGYRFVASIKVPGDDN